MKYYLAYGPNLNLVQMRQRCPNARVVGYTYLFGAMSMRGFLISTRSRQCRYSVSGTSLRDGKFCIILKQSFTPCPPATPWVFLPAAICRSARAGMMTFISASFRCAKLWLTAARSHTRSKGNTFVWKKRQKQKIGKREATFYRFIPYFAKQIWKN